MPPLRGILLGAVAVMMVAVWFAAAAGQEPGHADSSELYEPIARYLEARRQEFAQIPSERREALLEISRFIRERGTSDAPARLVFICTHNSRRSQMAQLWTAAAGRLSGVRVRTYSGGTQATAFNPRAVEALRRAGFKIEKTTEDENPAYHARFSDSQPPVTCFSKKITDPPNPAENFAAVMVCGQADKACPSVTGATARFAVAVEDPKEADGKPDEAAVYDERCAQIAREMQFVMAAAAR